MELLNKILVVMFVLSVLNVIRHSYYFIQSWVSTEKEETVKYRVSRSSLILFGISLAYIISSLFTGIQI